MDCFYCPHELIASVEEETGFSPLRQNMAFTCMSDVHKGCKT